MAFQLQNNYLPTDNNTMEFGWGPSTYAKSVDDSPHDFNVANEGMQQITDHPDDSYKYAHPMLSSANRKELGIDVLPRRFNDAISAFTCFEPFMQDCPFPPNTVDPTNLLSDSIARPNTAGLPFQGSSPSMSSIYSTEGSSIAGQELAALRSSPGVRSADSPSPTESEPTLRARHAANQRHNQQRQKRKDSVHDEIKVKVEAIPSAEAKKQRLREKNKIAAAKCRSRQRKQVQVVRQKMVHLSEKNAELKTQVQELRSELNSLRSIALTHQDCNCPVTRYNINQAERVIAVYRSSCYERGFGEFGPGFPTQ